MALIAGQPGGGKTLLALYFAITSGESVLYFSADSDEGTLANRSAAILLNQTVDTVKQMRLGEGEAEVQKALASLNQRVRIQTDASPSIDEIYEEVAAYIELYGDTPSIIIVDNLMNVASGTDSEWTGLRDTMNAFHSLARETQSHVMVLHHVSENESKPTFPASRKALMGKVSQLPELILTVALDGDRYHIAAVKNRDGISDPTAENYVSVCVDAPSMSLFNDHQQLAMARTRRDYK
jgi:RecA-family ATPase